MWKNLAARLFAMLLAAFFLSAAGPARAERPDYKFVMPVLKDLKLNFLGQLVEMAKDIIEKKTDCNFEVEELMYSYDENPIEKILDMMNAGEKDIALVYPAEYHYYLLDHKSNATPVFGMEMFGKKHADVCLYTRKSDGISDIGQLKGKTWGGVRARNARFLLHKLGIETPIAEYFGDLKFIPETNTADMIDKLLDGEIDVFTLPSPQMEMAFNADKKSKELVAASSCFEYMHNWLIVMRDDIPEEHKNQIKQVFLNLHKDPDFAGYRHLLRMVQGKFVEIEMEDIYETMKHATVYKQYGWMEEEQAYIKANYKKETENPEGEEKSRGN